MTHSDFVPASRPLLWDVRSCDEWLSRATLSDARQACQSLITLLQELEDAPPRQTQFLQILERLREPLLIAQEEQAKKFVSKPLPLGHVDSTAFVQSCDLWLALLRAYRRLLRSVLKHGGGEIAESLPLLLQRATEYTGELISTHLVARHEIGDWLWQGLHETYGFAEARGLAEVPVAEARARLPGGSTCVAAYVRPLLLELANPYGLTQREVTLTRRWAHRWSHKVRLTTNAADPGGFAADLVGNSGAQWTAADAGGASLRFLDTKEVLRSLKSRLKRLADGTAPAELGLGRDCVQPATGELLQTLFAAWGQAPRQPTFPRRPGAFNCQVVSGVADIHVTLSGGVKPEEMSPWDYSRHDHERMHVFQRTLQTTAKELAQPAIEGWETLDESANGFRLRRSGIGARVAHRQLVAVRPHAAHQFILCEVRWLMQTTEGALVIGTKAIPGLAQAVEVSAASNDPLRREPFVQAFVLQSAAEQSRTILLPAGWYLNGRPLLLKLEGESVRIRLDSMLGRGYDYDHAGFSPDA
ncbi:MAG: hypothetical protein HY661_01840 [Betaproteobacteria bacterium]|nr:hypothetical protein [Betaproteobacteria bacterium]